MDLDKKKKKIVNDEDGNLYEITCLFSEISIKFQIFDIQRNIKYAKILEIRDFQSREPFGSENLNEIFTTILNGFKLENNIKIENHNNKITFTMDFFFNEKKSKYSLILEEIENNQIINKSISEKSMENLYTLPISSTS